MSTNIYILRLQGGRFYVGKSADTARRYQEHLAGTASAWTRKYKPVALERVITNASPFDEDKYTKELMAKHGIDKVRGGAYVTEALEDFQEEALRREIWGAGDKCTLCGRAGHFVKDCYARTDVEGNEIISEDESECSSRSSGSGSPHFYNPFYGLQAIQKGVGAVQAPTKGPAVTNGIVRKGAIQAPTKGPAVTNEIVRKGAIQAPTKGPAITNEIVRKGAVQAPTKGNTCFRCGRTGHFVSECYANRHVKGYYINSDSE